MPSPVATAMLRELAAKKAVAAKVAEVLAKRGGRTKTARIKPLTQKQRIADAEKRFDELSAWLAAHDPLPFVVDDILVHFDDARSEAALRALASLADATQVILFTHHDHLVDLARATLPADTLHVHSLTPADVTR